MEQWGLSLLLGLSVLAGVTSQMGDMSGIDIKRQHADGAAMAKFIVSSDSISNCRYILYLEPMTYGDAAAKCATLRDRNSPTGKGRIAVVRNSGENDELSSLLQHAFGYKLKVSYHRKNDWTWIGQTLVDGVWRDHDGNRINFSAWEAGQPDGRAENGIYQSNIRLGKHGKWDDTFADKMHPFICTHTEHFIYSDTKVTWDEATEYCVYGGMTLAHSLNPRENVAIVKLAREKSPLDDLGLSHPYLNRNWAWIGASDSFLEGTWRWTRGSNVYFSNWEKSQPDNLVDDFLEGTTTDGQHYASISKVTGGWDDSFATRSREFVCMCEEHEFVMPDNLDDELQTMLQNQTEQWSELKAQLDSTVEVKMNSPPPECAVNRYFAYKERLNWNDAKAKCEERKMTLAKINSLKQNFDATRIMFQSDPIDMGSMGQYYSDDNWFWIGLTDVAQEGTFKWANDGTALSYHNWGSQQPDNIRVSDYSMRGQHYVAVHKLLRYWDDSDGNRKLPFLCQCPGWGNFDPEDVVATTEAPQDGEGPIVQASTDVNNGKRFIYHRGPASFWEAQSRCVNTGGNLACPSNSKQNEFVASIIRSTSWLGVLDYNVEGQFLCSSSERISYTNWGTEQPDNNDGEIGRKEADFVIIKHNPAGPDHGSWWDQGAMVYLMEYKYSFVCEADCVEGEDGCIPNDPARAE